MLDLALELVLELTLELTSELALELATKLYVAGAQKKNLGRLPFVKR